MDPRPSSYLVRLSSYLHASRRESGRASHGGPRSPSPLAHRTPDYAAQRRARGARSSTSSHIRHSLCFLSKVFVGQATQVSRSRQVASASPVHDHDKRRSRNIISSSSMQCAQCHVHEANRAVALPAHVPCTHMHALTPPSHHVLRPTRPHTHTAHKHNTSHTHRRARPPPYARLSTNSLTLTQPPQARTRTAAHAAPNAPRRYALAARLRAPFSGARCISDALTLTGE